MPTPPTRPPRSTRSSTASSARSRSSRAAGSTAPSTPTASRPGPPCRRLPRRTGIEATQTIKDLIPHAKILMLTISDEEADLYDAIKAGANGYLLKEISIEEVANAIRAVAQGQSLISPSMASKLLNEFATMVKRADEKQQLPTPRLTDREMEVLKLVAKGHNNRDIAKELYISENTVKNHIRNILEKLHLHSRMEAVVYAVREKLLEIK